MILPDFDSTLTSVFDRQHEFLQTTGGSVVGPDVVGWVFALVDADGPCVVDGPCVTFEVVPVDGFSDGFEVVDAEGPEVGGPSDPVGPIVDPGGPPVTPVETGDGVVPGDPDGPGVCALVVVGCLLGRAVDETPGFLVVDAEGPEVGGPSVPVGPMVDPEDEKTPSVVD